MNHFIDPISFGWGLLVGAAAMILAVVINVTLAHRREWKEMSK